MGVAALYLAIVARHFGALLTNTEINADASSAQVIAELYGAHSGTVVLGNMPWYSTLLFEWATAWLPAHRAIWDGGPYAIAVCSVLVMAWTAWRVAGPSVACTTAVLLLCASPAMLSEMLWLNNHMTSYYALALLAAYLVFLQSHAGTLSKLWLGLVTLLVGLVVGVNMGSDFLLTLVGPTSLLLAGIAAWRLTPRAGGGRAFAWSVGAVAVMGVTARITVAAMHSADIIQGDFTLSFASSQAIATNFRDWWESLAVLGNGDFFGAQLSSASALSAVCAGLTVVAVLYIPRFAWKSVERWNADRGLADPKLSAYVVFWASGCTLLSLAFIFSSAPMELGTTRYLNGVIFAAAALAPLWMARGAALRLAVIGGTLVFCIGSVDGLLRSGMIESPTSGPTPALAREVAAVAERQHVTRGYAEYWSAAPLTWFSHMRIHIYPAFGCGKKTMCLPGVNWMSSWYTPAVGERTFLLSQAHDALSPQPEFTAPVATYRLGAYTMTVYDENIAQYIT